MKRPFLALFALLLLLLAALPSAVARAQSGSGYDLTWYTVDGGGYTWSIGDGYRLGGTVGQADAGLLSGEGYILVGGFWGGATIEYRVYLPLVLRSN